MQAFPFFYRVCVLIGAAVLVLRSSGGVTGSDQIPPAASPLVIARPVAGSFHVYQRSGNSAHWTRWWLKQDPTQGTGMYGIKECSLYEWFPWNSIYLPETKFTGTWGISSSVLLKSLYQAQGLSGGSCEFTINGGGDLYLAYAKRPNGGYLYATVDGSSEKIVLPLTAGTRRLDTYSATTDYAVVRVARDLPAGEHVVRLFGSSTERNPASTGYVIAPDAWALLNPDTIVPEAQPQWQRSYAQSVMTQIGGQYTNGSGSFTTPAGWTAPRVIAETDFVLLGQQRPFTSAELSFAQTNTNSVSVAAQYWNGTNWLALPVNDGTSGFKQDGVIAFQQPADWATVSLNSQTRYWIRLFPSARMSPITLRRAVVTSANTPTRLTRFTSDGGQLEYAYNFMVGSGPIEDVGGELHGNESQLDLSITLDNAPVTLAIGEVRQASRAAFSQPCEVRLTTGGVVGNGSLAHMFSLTNLHVEWSHVFNQALQINTYAYSAMAQVNYWDAGTKKYVFDRFDFEIPMGEERQVLTIAPSSETLLDYGYVPADAVIFYNTTNSHYFFIHQPELLMHNRGFAHTLTRTFVRFNPSSAPPGGSRSTVQKAYISTVSSGMTLDLLPGESLSGSTYYQAGADDSFLVPGATQNLQAEAQVNAIGLQWDAIPGVEKYQVMRASSAAGPFAKLGDAVTGTQFVDSNLPPDVPYFYRVLAVNGRRTGEPSNSATAKAKFAPPSPPGSLTVLAVSPTRINLAWTDVATNETGYLVYYSLDNVVMDQLANLPPNSTSFAATGLSASTKYYFYVAAFNPSFQSTGAEVSATTRPLTPESPRDVTAVTGAVIVSWPTVSDASSYLVQRSTSAAGTFSQIGQTTQASWVDLPPPSGTSYFYKVVAVNSFGQSAPSPATAVRASLRAAEFVRKDAVSKGNWRGNYGAEGYGLLRDATVSPAYASWTTAQARSLGWTTTTTDPRALQKPSGTNRFAAAWHGFTQASPLDLDVAFQDVGPRTLSLYMVDFDQKNRSQKVEVFDKATGELVDAQTITDFAEGVYLTWHIRKPLRIRLTPLTLETVVVSGIFFDQHGRFSK